MQKTMYPLIKDAASQKLLLIDCAGLFDPHQFIVDYLQEEGNQDFFENIKIARPIHAYQYILMLESLEAEIMRTGAKKVIILGFHTLLLKLKKRELIAIMPKLINHIKATQKEFLVSFILCNCTTENPEESTNEITVREIMRNQVRKIIRV